MKNFRHYLTESVRTYKYKVKIAGEPDAKFLQLLTANLAKFDPVKIGEPKATPVQKSPYGFPDLENQAIHIMDCEFRYPCTEPMIIQMVQLIGYDPTMVRLVQTEFDDSINKEVEMYANQANPVLDQEEMPDNGKEASKDYANQYLDKLVPKKPTFDIPFAAKPTRDEDTLKVMADYKKSTGTSSPMTKINRPERPATGSRPSRTK
jgi:hypothetical protein